MEDEAMDLDELYEDFRADYDDVIRDINVAFAKWDEGKDSVFAAIKRIRDDAYESDLLLAANELARHEKGTNERELALHIFSTSRYRTLKNSLIYAELLVEESPDKSRKIIHEAIKEEWDEDFILEEIVKLCDHENPILVDQAHKELILMAKLGNLDTLHRLGYSYYYGKSGFEKDWTKAHKWWKKSADKGNEYSMLL